MENLALSDIIQTLVDWVLVIGGQVNDLPGGLAFALGLVTWFLVEQILRRILSWVRWLILVGVIVGLGFTVPYIFGEIFKRASLPSFGGEDTTPEQVAPRLDP